MLEFGWLSPLSCFLSWDPRLWDIAAQSSPSLVKSFWKHRRCHDQRCTVIPQQFQFSQADSQKNHPGPRLQLSTCWKPCRWVHRNLSYRELSLLCSCAQFLCMQGMDRQQKPSERNYCLGGPGKLVVLLRPEPWLCKSQRGPPLRFNLIFKSWQMGCCVFV